MRFNVVCELRSPPPTALDAARTTILSAVRKQARERGALWLRDMLRRYGCSGGTLSALTTLALAEILANLDGAIAWAIDVGEVVLAVA